MLLNSRNGWTLPLRGVLAGEIGAMGARNCLSLDMRKADWQVISDFLLSVRNVALRNSIFVTLRVDSVLREEADRMVLASDLEDCVLIEA